MRIKLKYGFHFDSAHFLPTYEGKCNTIHGHSYKCSIVVSGEIDSQSGMLMDFKDLKLLVKTTIEDKLDHKLLNDIIPNPTAENTAYYIYNELYQNYFKFKDIRLDSVEVYETENCSAIVT